MTEVAREKRQTFAWQDEMVMTGSEGRPGVHPVALATRAIMLSEALTYSRARRALVVTDDLRALMATGDLDAVGAMLASLEALVSPEIRAGWPLHEKCEPLRTAGEGEAAP